MALALYLVTQTVFVMASPVPKPIIWTLRVFCLISHSLMQVTAESSNVWIYLNSLAIVHSYQLAHLATLALNIYCGFLLATFNNITTTTQFRLRCVFFVCILVNYVYYAYLAWKHSTPPGNKLQVTAPMVRQH